MARRRQTRSRAIVVREPPQRVIVREVPGSARPARFPRRYFARRDGAAMGIVWPVAAAGVGALAGTGVAGWMVARGLSARWAGAVTTVLGIIAAYYSSGLVRTAAVTGAAAGLGYALVGAPPAGESLWERLTGALLGLGAIGAARSAGAQP